MKPRIKSMIWNTKRQKTSNQNNKKQKESKKMRIVQAAYGTTSRGPILSSYGCQRKRDIARNWKSIWKNNERKLP